MISLSVKCPVTRTTFPPVQNTKVTLRRTRLRSRSHVYLVRRALTDRCGRRARGKTVEEGILGGRQGEWMPGKGGMGTKEQGGKHEGGNTRVHRREKSILFPFTARCKGLRGVKLSLCVSRRWSQVQERGTWHLSPRTSYLSLHARTLSLSHSLSPPPPPLPPAIYTATVIYEGYLSRCGAGKEGQGSEG